MRPLATDAVLAQRFQATGDFGRVTPMMEQYTEIKAAQVAGLPDYPVFTRKIATDVSYLASAKVLLAATDVIYPAFATHNANTIAAIKALASR